LGRLGKKTHLLAKEDNREVLFFGFFFGLSLGTWCFGSIFESSELQTFYDQDLGFSLQSIAISVGNLDLRN